MHFEKYTHSDNHHNNQDKTFPSPQKVPSCVFCITFGCPLDISGGGEPVYNDLSLEPNSIDIEIQSIVCIVLVYTCFSRNAAIM